MKGLRCSVFRDFVGSCTNGPSHTCDELTLVGDGIPQREEVTEAAPAFVFVQRELFGKQRPYVKPPEAGHFQFSGNYLFCPDKGFPWDFPVPIHDRTEKSI